MSTNPIHSTGRGGAGNIGPDVNVYTDGGLVREGVQGESVDGEFSTGRGGAGNIGKSPRLGPQTPEGRRSVDLVPEINTREPQDEFHTGRGGAGNVYKEKYGGHTKSPDGRKPGLTDKIKEKLHLDGKKDKEPSPLAQNETTN
ncbi:Nn.00g056810.m01.CDS01 [Neocucurbitaria sp. VM-36]